VDVDSIDRESWDLSAKNPNAGEAAERRSPQEILAEIVSLDEESTQVLARIGGILG
jgi:type I restriction enzyme M protein